MRNVRLLVPPSTVAAVAYLKEATGTSLPYVYLALLEMALATAPLADLVLPVGNLIDRRAQAAARAAKSAKKGGEK